MITAQDIGVLAMIEKLTRIWVPEGTPRENIHVNMDGTWHRQLLDKMLAKQEARMTELYSGSGVRYKEDQWTRRLRNDCSSFLQFCVDSGDNTCFSYRERSNWWDLCSTEPFPSDEEESGYKFYGYMGLLRIWDDDELGEFTDARRWSDPTKPYSSAKRTEFSKRWLPYFRRNCWLCGCDIECSREERQKWVHGLTSEEIEDWQLKV
ncbi:hypothetical protein IAD21_01466 [Abditibacteriota bacterium]|nr:hypothetical protein IAD21_01466 [Abditibacteriota bacterium]